MMAVSDLAYDEIAVIAESIGLRPDVAADHYFLGESDVARRIVSTCGVGRHDRVVDVGAGLGATTLALLDAGAQVTAVEVDPALARRLPKTVADHVHSEIRRLDVLTKDVFDLRRDDAPAEPSVALVGLPSSMMTGAVLHLLTEFPSLQVVVAVARSILNHWHRSTPGVPEYDAAVARLRYLVNLRHVGALPGSAFWPVPPEPPDLIRLERLD